MILLVVEGESDRIFFEYVRDVVWQQSPDQVKITDSRGIDIMLQRTLPDAIKLLKLKQGLCDKVIAVFDWDEMHESHGKKTRIERLQELLQMHPRVGGVPVRENLEDLIRSCLDQTYRVKFEELKHKSKLAAVKWAIKQDLDQSQLKARLTDLQRSLQCQILRDFV